MIETQVNAPDGSVVTVRHPEGATEEQIIRFAQSQYKEPDIGIKGIGEAARSVASKVVAAPIAGIGGAARAINPTYDEGAGADQVKAIQDAISYEPESKEGQAALKVLADFFEPLGDAVEGTEKRWGEAVLNATGSPALATVAHSAPTLMMEVIGFGAGRSATKAAKAPARYIPDNTDSKKLLQGEAIPSTDELFDASREVYKELDEMGASLTPDAFNRLAKEVKKVGDDMGMDVDVTPKGAKAVAKVVERAGDDVPFSEVQNMRKVAQNAAKAVDGGDKAIGSAIIDTIDDFLARTVDSDFTSPPGANVGARQKVASNLWGRAKKSQLINNAIEEAKDVRSGFENGIRIELNKLIRTKSKTRRFFSDDEVKAIKTAIQGTKSANIFRALGRFSLMEGGAHNMLQPLAAMGVVSLYNPALMVAVPIIGYVSRQMAARLTEGSARFADEVVRAGKDGKKITAAYIRNTPKDARTAQDLAQLLLYKDTSNITNPLGKEAAEIATKANRASQNQ